MQIGLKPNEVLDMSLDMFKACSKGYTDYLFDLQLLSVQQGYWAGYYTKARKPKSLKSIIEKMVRDKNSHKKEYAISTSKPDVDVNKFQEMEAQFHKRWKEKK